MSCRSKSLSFRRALLLFFGLPLVCAGLSCPTTAQVARPAPAKENFVSRVWVADNGDGTYKNPILYADYSDPDVIRVGDDYYMVSSSFNTAPGLCCTRRTWLTDHHRPWVQAPAALRCFSKPQHGNGVWAPSIRYHGGEYYIFYPDPDRGIIWSKQPTLLVHGRILCS